MTDTDVEAQTTQVYTLVIKTTPEALWDAITKPEFTEQYFYGSRITVLPDHYSSVGPTGDLRGDEPVLEFDPPRRLVHGWRSRYDAELAEEDESRVTWEIEPQDDGTCVLTVVHDRLEGAPKTAASVSGIGWMTVLSGLKTFLETGEPLA
jgi:uncharacterized protein YndB with AHSA1/START domain